MNVFLDKKLEKSFFYCKRKYRRKRIWFKEVTIFKNMKISFKKSLMLYMKQQTILEEKKY